MTLYRCMTTGKETRYVIKPWMSCGYHARWDQMNYRSQQLTNRNEQRNNFEQSWDAIWFRATMIQWVSSSSLYLNRRWSVESCLILRHPLLSVDTVQSWHYSLKTIGIVIQDSSRRDGNTLRYSRKLTGNKMSHFRRIVLYVTWELISAWPPRNGVRVYTIKRT